MIQQPNDRRRTSPTSMKIIPEEDLRQPTSCLQIQPSRSDHHKLDLRICSSGSFRIINTSFPFSTKTSTMTSETNFSFQTKSSPSSNISQPVALRVIKSAPRDSVPAGGGWGGCVLLPNSDIIRSSRCEEPNVCRFDSNQSDTRCLW